MKNEMFLGLLDQPQWRKANSPLSQSEEQKIVLRATQHLHCHGYRTKGLPESLLVTVLFSFETISILLRVVATRNGKSERKNRRKAKKEGASKRSLLRLIATLSDP
jgi:hypothetical protein